MTTNVRSYLQNNAFVLATLNISVPFYRNLLHPFVVKLALSSGTNKSFEV